MRHSGETNSVFCQNLNSKQHYSLINKMVAHRNWFSHSKHNGTGFEDNENKEIAETLVLLLRVNMLQRLGVRIEKLHRLKYFTSK